MSFSVRVIDWAEAERDVWPVRRRVFVEEQRVPLELELDGVDPRCRHAAAYDDHGVCIGTARLLPEGKIGRMAVEAPWRGKGVGSALLEALMREAVERGEVEIVLDAQLGAMGFYEHHGFVAFGDVFLDAGIEHRRMRRALER